MIQHQNWPRNRVNLGIRPIQQVFHHPKGPSAPSTTASSSRINIPTSNQFEVLENNDGNSETLQDAAPTIKKTPRPPPITVTFPKFQQFADLITSEVKVLFRNTSSGTKILSSSMEDYNKVLGMAKLYNFEYFRHQISGNKPIKLFLRGLFETNPYVIKDALHSIGLIPLNVYYIPRSNSDKTFRDDKFLIHFDSKKVKISDILDIKVLNHQIISWHGVPRRKGNPTFCHNCLIEMDTESSTSSQHYIKKRPTKRQNSKDTFETIKKRTKPSDLVAPSIPTTNGYSILQNNDQEINNPRIVPAPPPIFVKKPGFYEIYKVLTKDHSLDVTFKSISLGCKVYAKNSLDYDKIKELFNVRSKTYQIHPLWIL